MKIDPATHDYLKGVRFSNGHRFELKDQRRLTERSTRLIEIVRGRRVLHVGCCDHLDLIRDKVHKGLYLHQRLCQVGARCVGVDINAKGVQLLHELGFPEVFLPDDVPQDSYDVCLLADVIEHVGDVVTFLQSMRRWQFKELVVVTPNLFRLRNWLSRGELVNTDHRYWFSPYTLCKVIVDAGYVPTDVELVNGDSGSWRGSALNWLLASAPKWRDALIVHANRN